MSDAYTGLSLAARRDEDNGYLTVGAYVDGVFVPLAAHKLPDFDVDAQAAKDAEPAPEPEQHPAPAPTGSLPSAPPPTAAV